ncbi:MAG: DUF4142 domain-containing protein [Nitrospira sp.]|nr:DUF4142 domain-containing protein [Nitrospira sp. BO4]
MSHPIVSIVCGIAVVVSTSWAMAAPDVPPQTTEAFLQKAAAGQQQHIDLGQIATQKAESEQVKQFGARMVADHQKARKDVERLASNGGLQLVNQSSDSLTGMKAELDAASGKGFDRAYITLMLREHAKEMKELEKRAGQEKNQEVRQWVADAVPVVKDHLAQAKTIASSLGVPEEHLAK